MIFGIAFLCSCKERGAVTITTFNEMPGNEYGPGYYFAGTDSDAEKRNYVFTQDFDTTGFISLNNKLIRLKLKKDDRKNFDNLNETFVCSDYKVIISAHYIENAVNNWEGTITINDKSGLIVKKNITGFDLQE